MAKSCFFGVWHVRPCCVSAIACRVCVVSLAALPLCLTLRPCGVFLEMAYLFTVNRARAFQRLCFISTIVVLDTRGCFFVCVCVFLFFLSLFSP